MEQPSLLGQPVELLVKQLSDPEITLEDFDNFCNSNSELREICRTNPLFVDLRERKTPVIDVEVKFTRLYDESDEATEFLRTVNIKFYSRIKRFILTNSLLMDRFNLLLFDTEEKDYKDYIPSNMEELKKKYNDEEQASIRRTGGFGDGLFDGDALENFETFKTDGNWLPIRGRGYDDLFELITQGDGSKMVRVYNPDEDEDHFEFYIPLDLLESAVSVARSISDGFSGGSATITLNGDVIYGKNTGVVIKPDF